MKASSTYTVIHIQKGLTLFDHTAIANWKALKAKLSRLEELSRLVIFRTTPDTRRSKRPTKATLGLGKRPKSP